MSGRPFAKKVAVVTGAGGTLCSAVALKLAREGASVALLGRTEAKLLRVEEQIRTLGGKAVSFEVDVTDEQSLQEARERIIAELGPCSLLVNGAGGNQTAAVTSSTEFFEKELELGEENYDERGFFNLDMEVFADVIRVNTMGTVLPSRIFARDMARSGGGSIVNFASMNSYRPLSRVAPYGMAKAGVVNFTQWLAVYLAPAKIRVNAVAPGFFVNDRSRKILMDEQGGLTTRGRNVIAHTPLRAFGEADALTGCVSWLLDDARAAFVTGTTVPVDGGFLAFAGI